MRYKKVLIKLSGEALSGSGSEVFDAKAVENVLTQIKALVDAKVQVGIVVGGGNIFRGMKGKALGLKQVSADYMGMLATIMNGIALQDFLHNHGISSKVYSALDIPGIVNPYQRHQMLNDLANGEVVIFVAGIGQPLFTTDSGAALRAVEMEAELLIKATKVDGVYDRDPIKYPDAKKYDCLGFAEVLDKQLQVMDLSAFELCKANEIDILVCNIFNSDTLVNAVSGKMPGTLVSTKC